MSYSTIRIETDARGVATLTLDRAEKHNALSSEMMDELIHAAGALGADDAVRVVVLTGAGRSFCAGGDLKWMQDQQAMDIPTRKAEARKLAEMLQALNSLPKPLIGRVQGQAFGGGVGMMSVCDIAIGVEGARFGLTETRLGLIPATIGPYVVARMGAAKARRVFMSSRIFDAAEAAELNLLAKVVSADELDAAVEAEVAPYLTCAPRAVADAKRLAQDLCARIGDDVIDMTVDALAARWEDPESVEGITAFFEKRKAEWMK